MAILAQKIGQFRSFGWKNREFRVKNEYFSAENHETPHECCPGSN